MTSRRKRNITITVKWLVYFVILLVAATLQSTPGFLQFGNVKPLFILPVCLAVAIYEGEYSGAFFGVFGGLMWDWTAGRVSGLMALGVMIICFVAAIVVEMYLRLNYVNFILVNFACCMLVASTDFLFYYAMPGYSGAWMRYATVVVPMAVVSAILSPLAMIGVRWVKKHFIVE